MSSRFLQSPSQHSQGAPRGNRRYGRVPSRSPPDSRHAASDPAAMQESDDGDSSDSRPLSFAPSQQEKQLERKASQFSSSSTSSTSESPLSKTISSSTRAGNANGDASPVTRKRQVSTGSLSNGGAPDLSRASSTDTATQAFPLNDIDYESSPAAVAQELSNLQAIRRMSMNVDAADPDLPSFSSGLSLPSVAPSATADENDTARLFWVPARLHPELAPKDYRSFVEDRVDRIKRRSEDDEPASPTSPGRSLSGDSKVDRRKSMLSRTVEVASDLKDGADVLDRRRSSHRRGPSAETSLQELEQLVNDPSSLMRKMSIDQSRQSLDSDSDMPQDEDMPMLPAPLGSTLKRSRRTQYNRRGSLRRDARAGRRRTVEDSDSGSAIPPVPSVRSVESQDDLSPRPESPEPDQDAFHMVQDGHSKQDWRQRADQESAALEGMLRETQTPLPEEVEPQRPKHFHSKIASHGRTTAHLPGYSGPQTVPTIVETPADARHSIASPPSDKTFPERKSSHGFNRTNSLPSIRPVSKPAAAPVSGKQKHQSLDQVANNPAPMPGTNTDTEALSFIPTVTEPKKPEKEKKSKKESSESSSRKGGWGWLLGSEDKRKEDRDEKEAKKSRNKHKSADKSHDNARLDVLQTASDSSRGRESLVLDRDTTDFRLEEERKKTSSRKAGSEKKEREPGILSSLFGVAKKKADKDGGGSSKKQPIIRGLTPEPPRRSLLPDIDYNWTRFSILEERAIYRMAHIKLANPRRPLQSQVLLSNFMYSYLAKVQQMHPHMIPQHQQKGSKKQQEQQRESDEYSQWQRYQEQQQDRYSSGTGQANGDPYANESATSNFLDEYDNNSSSGRYHEDDQLQGNNKQQWPQERDAYAQQGLFDDDRPPEDDDMW